MALLNRRYRIQKTLGERRLATTLLAFDEHTERPCVVKRLSLRRAFNSSISEVGVVSGSETAKLVELFEREGRILAHLDHPRIPRFVDQFSVKTAWDTELYMVQEYIDAPSLAAHVAAGRHFTESQVVQLGIQMAEVLAYLHGRSPPLIHRDIKPSNILYHDTRGAFLIDFGVVKDRMTAHALDGGTVVGTFDYMPLEQYHGNAVPATDIYSLGMTLIAVLSHLDPSDVSRRGAVVDFRPHVQITDRFGKVIERMVEALPERRYSDASHLHRDLTALLNPTPVKRRRRVLIAGSIAAVLLMAGSGAVISRARSGTGTTDLARTGRAAVEAPLESASQPSSDARVAVVDGVLRLNLIEDFRYVDQGWPLGLSAAQSAAGGPDSTPFEPLRREPRYASRRPQYGYLPLGNGEDARITYVIDELERPSWVLYVDKNNNEDLTDDGPPYQNEGSGRLAANVTVAFDVVTPSGTKGALPYKLWFWVNEAAASASTVPTLRARFYARSHYAAKVAIGGTVFDAVVYELDRHNGLFRENGIWIDLDRDGQLGDAEHFEHGERLTVGATQFRIHLDFP